VVALSAAKHGERIERQMRQSIGAVATKKVLLPIAEELSVYAEFRKTVVGALRLSTERRSVS
jgi:hypothetical protein